jgi:hypothetical protein
MIGSVSDRIMILLLNDRIAQLEAVLGKREEIISDWVSDIAMRDGGKVFEARVSDLANAPVTYGDLRKLMTMDSEASDTPAQEVCGACANRGEVNGLWPGYPCPACQGKGESNGT